MRVCVFTIGVCLFYHSCPNSCKVVSYVVCVYWPFVYLLGRNVCPDPLPIFNRVIYLFMIELQKFLCILGTSFFSVM